MTTGQNNETATDKRFWELYLVRYLIPSIVSGICLGYLFIASSLNHPEFTDFKTTIEWLSKNFNTIMFIVWGIISFAVMYIFSGITMAIHVLRSYFIGVNPLEYYYKTHESKSKFYSSEREFYKNYRESYRHLREHGTAFEVSLYLILVTLYINPIIFDHHCFGIICIIIFCLLGTISGNYFGIRLELYFDQKQRYKCWNKKYCWIYFIPLLSIFIMFVCAYQRQENRKHKIENHVKKL